MLSIKVAEYCYPADMSIKGNIPKLNNAFKKSLVPLCFSYFRRSIFKSP